MGEGNLKQSQLDNIPQSHSISMLKTAMSLQFVRYYALKEVKGSSSPKIAQKMRSLTETPISLTPGYFTFACLSIEGPLLHPTLGF